MVSATCPVCDAPQDAGLMCHACTNRLERDLGDVASIVGELDITTSKQAKIGNGSGPGGLARERSPLNMGSMQVADNLQNTLTTWARDVGEIKLLGHERGSGFAAAFLLLNIDAIRRHPAVNELVDEISDAIAQARRVVDRPADRIFVGPCLVEHEGVTCHEDLYARAGASWVVCKVCGSTHEVAERRTWLLEQARDRLFTVRESAQMLGDVGGQRVTEDRIRGYMRRGRLVDHPIGTKRGVRLGDLLDIIASEGEKKSA